MALKAQVISDANRNVSAIKIQKITRGKLARSMSDCVEIGIQEQRLFRPVTVEKMQDPMSSNNERDGARLQRLVETLGKMRVQRIQLKIQKIGRHLGFSAYLEPSRKKDAGKEGSKAFCNRMRSNRETVRE